MTMPPKPKSRMHQRIGGAAFVLWSVSTEAAAFTLHRWGPISSATRAASGVQRRPPIVAANVVLGSKARRSVDGREDVERNVLLGEEESPKNPMKNSLTGLAAAISIGAAVAFSPMSTTAYDASDYASETVTAAVQNLKSAAGDADRSFGVFEDIAAIISEGKGVGGSLSYTGVQLERGYVSDEDTTIYNPGLSLLTESEKERMVDALVNNRKVGLQKGAWSENNELAFGELKQKLDPLHMFELKGYLGFLPFYGAAVYLATLFVQQNFRGFFPVAYIIGAVAVFGPIVALVAVGP